MTDVAGDSASAADGSLSLLPILQHYEEKRRYPRIDVRVPVMVTTPDHQVVHARVRNVSSDGVQIRCDRDTAARVLPAGRRLVPGEGPLLRLRFELQVGMRRRPFAATAKVCYVAARDAQEIALGLEFTRLSLEAKQLLWEYLVECMRPA